MEKATYIEKEHKNQKTGEKIVIRYRTDADFVPTEIGQICYEFIEKYVEANGKEEWLDEQYAIEDNTFMKIRSNFAKDFFNIEPTPTRPMTNKEKWQAKRKAEKENQ